MSYISTKTWGHEIGLSAAFRQWRATSHCHLVHGYALSIRLEFEADELDHRNWVIDFGGLKDLKRQFEATFDHKTLVAKDDPHIDDFRHLQALGLIELVEVKATGCEAFAQLVYDMARNWLVQAGHSPRVWVRSVEVKEHGANSAIFTNPDLNRPSLP